MHPHTENITRIVRKAAERAKLEQSRQPDKHVERDRTLRWPIDCTIGPGLEGAIACETKIGYVNGTRGDLVYRGHRIFDLCVHSTFEEVSYLLLKGKLPSRKQLDNFEKKLKSARHIPDTLRKLSSFPIEEMNSMSALRLGTNLMRQNLTWRDMIGHLDDERVIASDDDSQPMETTPWGESQAVYEFRKKREYARRNKENQDSARSLDSCIRLISGIATVTAAIARLQQGKLPIEPDPDLGHAANFLYMLNGTHPTDDEARIFDISLILHADHGMNASTFSSMVVASTMSDIYFSIGAGIAALNGPLHGGANEQVIKMLEKIGTPDAVPAWYVRARKKKQRVMGFGHRVYKVYDPRARILGPLADYAAQHNPKVAKLYETAKALEHEVIETIGKEKGIFPNVDFYSGLVYQGMGIPSEMFTPIFAVSRVAGWTARVMEYLKNNRIFRPRAIYTGAFDREYTHISQRGKHLHHRHEVTKKR